MKYIPIQLALKDKKILVVGGGAVALQKITGILTFTQAITVIAPEVCDTVREKGVTVIGRAYADGDASGFSLVYVCTNVRAVNERVARDARAHGALVCVADYPDDCDFISPAVYVDDPMVVAVSSSGDDIKKTITWRNKIKELFSRDNA